MDGNIYVTTTPRRFNSLLPDLEPMVVSGFDGNSHENDSETYNRLLGNNPIGHSSGTITVTASGSAGDVFSVTIRGKVYNVVSGGGTTTAEAAAIARFIDSDTVAFHLFTATSATNIVTIRSKYPGVLGNSWTLAVSATGTATATASGATLTSGLGQFITPVENIVVQLENSTVFLWAGRPVPRTVALVNALAHNQYLVA
jgi:hypothetical protein